MELTREPRGIMNFRLIKERFKQLQKGPYRWLVAAVATFHQIIKHRSLIYIYIDEEGDWHNCRRDVIFVSPELNVSSYGNVLSSVIDLWCYDCTLKRGGTVIDIGAGIGDDVVVFSRLVGASGHVIAIEAHPDTFRCLIKTIKANQLKNVTAFNVAALDQEKEVSITCSDNFITNSVMGEVGGIQVRGCALDTLLQEFDSKLVDLIKMNIEGSETVALLGMKKLLHNASNLIVSCHDFIAENHGGGKELRTLGDVTKIMKEAGYIITVRSDSLREEVRDYLYGKRLMPTLDD